MSEVQQRSEPRRGDQELLYLNVHPSVVFKLGADLITDDVQALVELVKNSYDADSPGALIEIFANVWTDPVTGEEVTSPPLASPGGVEANEAEPTEEDSDDGRDVEEAEGAASDPPPVQGMIVITDHGVGMTYEDITRGWLTVSASKKRLMKAEGKVTAKKRTPLGDKGLGRLGAQRLGDILEIETTPKDEDVTYRIRIPWGDYETAESLQDVTLSLTVAPREARKAGTTLRVRGLRNLEHWSGEGLADVERELSVMVSPYGQRGFNVTLRAEEDKIDLASRPREVREQSLIRYNLTYSEGVLSVRGQISTKYFQPNAEKDQAEYRVLVEQDNGAVFRDWLLASAPDVAASIGLTAGDEKYFIEVSTQIELKDQPKVRIGRDTGQPVDPGPFNGEVDSVPLRADPTDVFQTVTEYRNYVRQINGVRVYRDGFGIRVDEDWLHLGAQWTAATSYYTLKPENVIGYVDLSAEHNGALLETTNREGFQDTSAHRNFMLLMEAWLGFTERAQGAIRRGYVAYRKTHAEAAVGDAPLTADAIADRAQARHKAVHRSVEQSRQVQSTLSQTLETIENATREDNLFGLTPEMGRSLEKARAALQAVNQLTADLEGMQSDYDSAVKELTALQAQVEAVQEQLASAWEAVSVGITAEALSHEVHHIADRLRARSQQVTRHLQGIDSKDLAVAGFVEHVRSSAAALNRQLAHLNPALRYMRERRTALSMAAVTNEVVEHFTQKWEGRPLSIEGEVTGDFKVLMNGGKLTQVLDNLVLNSEFWLQEQQRRGQTENGQVTIRVESPCITVTDTGPGVDPSVESLIFEPFVTTKGRGVGRGLGLFVTRQLLATEGAEIELDPDRGDDGRRRTFRITFHPTRGGSRA